MQDGLSVVTTTAARLHYQGHSVTCQTAYTNELAMHQFHFCVLLPSLLADLAASQGPWPAAGRRS
jgi:hypothetical protein